MLERDADLGLIEDALDRGARGNGGTVLIEGPAGIGKTALLEASAARARPADLRVLRARGHSLEQDLAGGVLRQLLERELNGADPARLDRLMDGAAALTRSVFTEVASPGGLELDDGAFPVMHGLHWLVVNLAAEGPLAMVVDDAHWSDALSLRALAYLARRLDGLAATLMIASRPTVDGDVRRDLLAALRDDHTVAVVRPRPLSRAATGALVASLAERSPGAEALDVLQEITGGNPFLVVEATRALMDAGQQVTAESVSVLRRSASDSLASAVMLRLGALGDDATLVARGVAVLGDEADLAHLCELTGLTRELVVGAAGLLIQARIIADTIPWRFEHPLLQGAVYRDLTEGERSLAHERAAAVIESLGGDRGRVAAHLLLARPAASARTVRLLAEVAEYSLAVGDAASAIRYLRRALAEPPPESELAAVLAALGEAELEHGDAASAAEHLRAAMPLLNASPRRPRAVVALGQALLISEGPASAVAGLEQWRTGLDPDELVRVDTERAWIAMYVPEATAAAAQHMSASARLPGQTYNERFALAGAALATVFDRTQSAAASSAIASRACAEETIAADFASDTYQFSAAIAVLIHSEEFALGEHLLAIALRDLQRRGSGSGFAAVSLMLAQSTIAQGRLGETIAHCEAVIATAAEIPRTAVSERFFASAPALLLTWALVDAGDSERAHAVITSAIDGRDLERPELCLLFYGRGVARAGAGDHEGALSDFLAYGAMARALGYEERLLVWRQLAALAASAAGDTDRAASLALEAVELARVWGAPGGLGAALRAAALVGADGADRAEGLQAAVDTLRRSQWRLELARALIDLGIVQRHAGMRVLARSSLAEGLDLASACGARPLAERARGELRIAGARPRRDRITSRDSLTPSELRIATRVAEGLTNRQVAHELFVTPKTVEQHLSSIFRKLDISSRTMLASALEESE